MYTFITSEESVWNNTTKGNPCNSNAITISNQHVCGVIMPPSPVWSGLKYIKKRIKESADTPKSPRASDSIRGWACLNIRWHTWHMESVVTSLLLFFYYCREGRIRFQSSIILQQNDLGLLLSFCAAAFFREYKEGKNEERRGKKQE